MDIRCRHRDDNCNPCIRGMSIWGDEVDTGDQTYSIPCEEPCSLCLWGFARQLQYVPKRHWAGIIWGRGSWWTRVQFWKRTRYNNEDLQWGRMPLIRFCMNCKWWRVITHVIVGGHEGIDWSGPCCSSCGREWTPSKFEIKTLSYVGIEIDEDDIPY